MSDGGHRQLNIWQRDYSVFCWGLAWCQAQDHVKATFVPPPPTPCTPAWSAPRIWPKVFRRQILSTNWGSMRRTLFWLNKTKSSAHICQPHNQAHFTRMERDSQSQFGFWTFCWDSNLLRTNSSIKFRIPHLPCRNSRAWLHNITGHCQTNNMKVNLL